MTARGVYLIRCEADDGRCYVGSSEDIKQRWRLHRSDLRKGVNSNKPLQAAWDHHGAEAFEWLVLEEVPSGASIIDAEQGWIDRLSTTSALYNVCLSAKDSSGYRHTPSTKQKLATLAAGNTHNRGSRHGMAKLVEADVLAIRARLDRGETATNIAPDFGVSRRCIRDIATGRRWGHLASA